MHQSERNRPLSRFMDPPADAALETNCLPDRELRSGVGEADYVGEVIESSTTEALAEARQLNAAPPFGGFVRIDSALPAVGIVCNVSTQSLEANRRPAAYGKTERELRLEQPQIFELLRTHFQILIVGYLEGEQPVPVLPPHPAPIHSFVYECTGELVCACTASDEFLRNILNTSGPAADQLLIATLRHALRARDDSRDYLVAMGKSLSRLLRDDYDRLSSLIRRIALTLN